MIRDYGKVGHIEDIVVDKHSRGLGVGKIIMDHLVKIANDMNCYKIILNTKEENVKFYEKCGFEKKDDQMVIYLWKANKIFQLYKVIF